MTLIASGEFKPAPDTTLGFTYTLNDVDLYDKYRNSDNYSLMFTVRQLFNMKTSDKWGRVKINIFVDRNDNGKFDSGEGISDVLTYVINGRHDYTNKAGSAFIKKVVPGLREVKIDLRNLPVYMMVKESPVQEVKVEPLKTAVVNFELVLTGSIRGRVFVDVDKNGVYDKGRDVPIPNVRIFIRDGNRDSLTFSDGTYILDYVSPGSRDVVIDPLSIDKDLKLVSPLEINVNLEEQGRLEDVNFILRQKDIQVQYFE